MNGLLQELDLCSPNIVLSLLESHTIASETQRFDIDNDSRFISFTLFFKYLSSLINFLLDDSTDVRNRINLATKKRRNVHSSRPRMG